MLDTTLSFLFDAMGVVPKTQHDPRSQVHRDRIVVQLSVVFGRASPMRRARLEPYARDSRRRTSWCHDGRGGRHTPPAKSPRNVRPGAGSWKITSEPSPGARTSARERVAPPGRILRPMKTETAIALAAAAGHVTEGDVNTILNTFLTSVAHCSVCDNTGTITFHRESTVAQRTVEAGTLSRVRAAAPPVRGKRQVRGMPSSSAGIAFKVTPWPPVTRAEMPTIPRM